MFKGKFEALTVSLTYFSGARVAEMIATNMDGNLISKKLKS